MLLDEAYAKTNALLRESVAAVAPDCICLIPRIVDYISRPRCDDANFLIGIVLRDSILVEKRELPDTGSTVKRDCSNCLSTWIDVDEERGESRLFIDSIGSKRSVGPKAEKIPPSYLTPLSIRLFRNPWGHAEVRESTLEDLIAYLFERTTS